MAREIEPGGEPTQEEPIITSIINNAPFLLDHQKSRLIRLLNPYLSSVDDSALLCSIEQILEIKPSEDDEELSSEEREVSITDAIKELLDVKKQLKDFEEENEKLKERLEEKHTGANATVVRAVIEGLLDTTYVQLSSTEQFRIIYELQRHGITDEFLDKTLRWED